MDGQRFDTLTRLVATQASRRRLTKGAIGAAVGLLLGRLEVGEAAATCGAVGSRCRRDAACCGRCVNGRCQETCAGRRCGGGERCLPVGSPDGTERTCCPAERSFRDCSSGGVCETPDGPRCCSDTAPGLCCPEANVCGPYCCPPGYACRVQPDGSVGCECIEICALPRRAYAS